MRWGQSLSGTQVKDGCCLLGRRAAVDSAWSASYDNDLSAAKDCGKRRDGARDYCGCGRVLHRPSTS
jgi:hypothetical protein